MGAKSSCSAVRLSRVRGGPVSGPRRTGLRGQTSSRSDYVSAADPAEPSTLPLGQIKVSNLMNLLPTQGLSRNGQIYRHCWLTRISTPLSPTTALRLVPCRLVPSACAAN